MLCKIHPENLTPQTKYEFTYRRKGLTISVPRVFLALACYKSMGLVIVTLDEEDAMEEWIKWNTVIDVRAIH